MQLGWPTRTTVNMQHQRNHAKPMSGRPGNLRVNEPIGRSLLPGLSIDQTETTSTFINAPTSLTNLAQLSGISLVPICDRQPAMNAGPNNSQVISFSGNQQPKITVSANSRQHLHGVIKLNSSSSSAPGTSMQYPPVYNLETIPSMQHLNRVSSDQRNGHIEHAAISRPLNAKPRSQAMYSNRAAPNHQSSGTKKARSQAHLPVISGRPLSTTKISVLPVSESIDLNFIPKNAREYQHQSVMLSRPLSPTDQESDNMSLMKLMAIFNNPALTITAVGPATIPVGSFDQIDRPQANLSQSDYNHARSRLSNKSGRSRHNEEARSSNTTTSDGTQINRSTHEIFGNEKNVTKHGLNTQRSYFGSVETMSNLQRYTGNTSDGPQSHVTGIDSIQEEPHTVTLSWSPRGINAGASNEISLPASEIQSTNPVDPKRMLEDFLAATEKSESQDHQVTADEDMVTECVTVARKPNWRPLSNVAKCMNINYLVFSNAEHDKKRKEPVITTKRRLYLPRSDEDGSKKLRLSCLNQIEIIEEQEENFLSDRHQVLSKIDEIADSVGQKRPPIVEPDDIFIDRSKRVMSVIDTEIEKRRKRNFEKISQRSPQDEEEDEETGFGLEVLSTVGPSQYNEYKVLPIQLPLEMESQDDLKRDYLLSVGLVSRAEKDNLIAQQYAERLNNLSLPVASCDLTNADEDIVRIVDTLIQTGGNDIVLRTETDIKRNELPFIEGLNRNSSRVKMTYMNALGLEKRSKRTTLYKVVKPQEAVAANSQEVKQHGDLSQKAKNLMSQPVLKPHQMSAEMAPRIAIPVKPVSRAHHQQMQSMRQDGAHTLQTGGGGAEILRKAIRMAQASCREAINRAPNKDEYMKSLGLMAS